MTFHTDFWYLHIMVVLKPSATVYVFKIIYACRMCKPVEAYFFPTMQLTGGMGRQSLSKAKVGHHLLVCHRVPQQILLYLGGVIVFFLSKLVFLHDSSLQKST